MRRKNLKSIIAMALTIATAVTVAGPTIAYANEISKAEYTSIFKDDTRTVVAYEELRAKWVELLTGNSLSGLKDPDAAKNIKLMDESVKESIEDADLDISTDYVWDSLVDGTSKSATITAQFKRIKEIAVAYKTKDSSYYNNTELLNVILKATEKMHNKHYNKDTAKMPNNWWDWQIGTPRELVDIIVLIDEDFGDLKGKLIEAVDRFVPDATKRLGQAASFKETGANLLDKALIVAIRGIADGNDEKVSHAATVVQEVFPYVTKGDGFYTDGSFLQHGDIAYTGSYGAVLLDSLSNLLYIVQDTEYKIDTEDYYNLFRWMKDSYEPIMAIGGNVTDNVRGRAISRKSQQGDSRGKFIISSMLRIASIAPNAEAENYIKSITKRWINEGSSSTENYFVGLSAGNVANMKNVLNDTTISQSPERNYYKQFYYMDRAVSNRSDYNFTVSMSSSRIANHEDINGESTKAWYTGQGMTQLYTNDLQQYNEDFWPTVDPMRLPGVTSDGQTRKFTDKGNSSAWAGGTTVDGVNGVSGMEILPSYRTADGTATGMSARKSWFMFENEIVAVGSNISSTDKDVETIIDNRKINDSADNTFLVDGTESTKNVGDENTVEANWAHLEGNVDNSDIGYVFPNKTEITTKRETRTHKWSEINTKAEFTDTADNTRSYLSLAIDHGNAPTAGTYEYVILPNATAEETAAYSEDQKIEILANNEKFHAVYHKEENIYAINVFEATKISEKLEVSGPASIMIKELEGGGYKVSVSNPTKLEDKIDFIFTEDELGDFNVSGEGTEVKNVISVDTSSRTGETYEFTLSPKKIAVESVTLDKTELALKVGEKSKLTVTINPESATDKNVVWISEDESIVKVDEEGNIEALSEGEALIKATVDGKEATCLVKVEKLSNNETPDDNDKDDTDNDKDDESNDKGDIDNDNAGNDKDDVDNDKDGTSDNEDNLNSDKDNSGNSSTGNTSDDKESSAKTPYTGDTSSVVALGLTMVVSAGGAFALKKKKNK